MNKQYRVKQYAEIRLEQVNSSINYRKVNEHNKINKLSTIIRYKHETKTACKTIKRAFETLNSAARPNEQELSYYSVICITKRPTIRDSPI